MKFIVADDHALFRTGIRTALVGAFGEQTVVFEAANYAGTKSTVFEHADADVILCDLHMPGMSEFDGLRKLIESIPRVPVVIVSASDDPRDVRRAVECGARGYIFKHQSFEILQSALELVLAGGVYVPAEAFLGGEGQAQLLETSAESAKSPLSSLSDRQTTIAALLARGMSNKEIARGLNIAEGTVKVQIKSIFRKLGVRNRTEAALVANRDLNVANSSNGQASTDNSSSARPDPNKTTAAHHLVQKVYAFRNRG